MRQVDTRIARTLFGKVYDDLAGWKTSCASPAWTGPSSGRRSSLTNRSPAATALSTAERARWPVHPRADVAHYMLAVLAQPGTIGQVIGIAT
jgi:hypothetical protein